MAIPHGTIHGFIYHQCRCESCTDVHRTYMRRYRLKRMIELTVDQDDPRHGTNSAYATGCRCERCRAANRAYRETRKGTR